MPSHACSTDETFSATPTHAPRRLSSMGVEAKASRLLVHALLFLVPALSLLWQESTLGGTILLGLMGMWLRVRKRANKMQGTPQTVFAMASFAWALILINLWHGESWGGYHISLGILLCLPAYWAVRLSGANVRWAYWGALVGVISGFAFVAVQAGGIGGRWSGVLLNPIPLGGVGLTLAAASGIGYFFQPKWAASWFWSLLSGLGACSGVLISVFSGSKAGWVALPFLFLLLIVELRKHGSSTNRTRLHLALLALLLAFAFAFFQGAGPQRIENAWNGFLNYVESGQISEGSIGPRLEMWRFGVDHALTSPWLGMGRDGLVREMHAAAARGEYIPGFKHWLTLHNEFLHVYIAYGVVGLLAIVWVYLALWRDARQASRGNDRPTYLMLMALLITFLALGTGEVATLLKGLRNIFFFWAFVLAGGLAQRMDRQASPTMVSEE